MVGSAWLATPKRVFVALANIFKADTVPDVRLIHVSRKSDGLEREDSRSGAFDWMLKRIGAASDAETDGAFATERLILITDVERNAFDGPVFVYLQSPFDVQSLPLRLCE